MSGSSADSIATGDSWVGAGAAAVIPASTPASGTLAQDELADRSSSLAHAFPQGAQIGCSGALARCSRECSALTLRSISASFATAASAYAWSVGE